MIYYIDINNEDVITDVVTKATEGYTMIDIDLWRYKYSIHNGCYKWDNLNNKVVLSTLLEETYLKKIEEEEAMEYETNVE